MYKYLQEIYEIIVATIFDIIYIILKYGKDALNKNDIKEIIENDDNDDDEHEDNPVNVNSLIQVIRDSLRNRHDKNTEQNIVYAPKHYPENSSNSPPKLNLINNDV